MSSCAWCSAPRAGGEKCPRCGADYAVEDPALEFKLCAAAIPAALALGLLFHILTPGLQRIFFGMPIHELGHALAAQEWGWSIRDLVRRYVTVGVSCLAALALVYAWGVRNAFRKAFHED